MSRNRATRRVLAAALVALAPGGPLRASVTGNLELAGSVTQDLSGPGGGTTSSTLVERLSLHYAGLPFGPDVAVATLGGAFSNVTAWQGPRQLASGRILSFDASVGFLPRRAVPLRLYAAGTVDAGTTGPLAVRGAGPSLLYGGTLSLEPGEVTPALRLDGFESRGSRPGHERMSDLQRRLTASSSGTFAGQRLSLDVRLDRTHLDGAGDVDSRTATLQASSAVHQTSVVAQEVERSLPILTGIDRDRLLSANSDQRWSSAFRSQLGARWTEAGGGGATGTIGEARAAVAWTPVQGKRQLTFSGGGSAGFARTTAAVASADGTSWGANGRAAYGQPLGPVSCTLGAGAAVTACDCAFGNDGRTTIVDATLSLSLLSAGRASAQAEYGIGRASAPLSRGGDRLEQHARGYGRLAVGLASSLSASLAYDDAVRELIDITTARAESVQERAVTATLGGATRRGAVALTAEASQTVGTVAAGSAAFVAGGARQLRSVTTAQVGAAWNPLLSLGLQAQLVATRADVTDAAELRSLGANLALACRLGQILASAQWQLTRFELGGGPASTQHSVHAVVSRPFEL